MSLGESNSSIIWLAILLYHPHNLGIMTKKNIATTLTSISICSLFFSSCGTISKYRKDPSEWDNPTQKVAKVKKVKKTKVKTIKKAELPVIEKEPKKKKGIFGFFSKLRKDPSEWDKKETVTSTVSPTVAPVVAPARTPITVDPIVSAPTLAPTVSPRITNAPSQVKTKSRELLPLPKATSKKPTNTKGQRRRIPGLLAPNADKLPNQKDLQEVQSIAPNTNSNGGIKIPTTP